MKTITGVILAATVLASATLFLARQSLSPVTAHSTPRPMGGAVPLSSAHFLANMEEAKSTSGGNTPSGLSAVRYHYPQTALDLPAISASRPLAVTDVNGQKQSAPAGARYPSVALDR